MPQYRRAPITEAVIEIRYEKPLPGEQVDLLRDKLAREYASCDPLTRIGVAMNPARRRAVIDESGQGYRLASADRADVLLVTPGAMACSRLAPYQGWDDFSARARSNWKAWKRVVRYRPISRIGVRYINRIDIPTDGARPIQIEDYLSVFPAYPEPDVLPAISSYTMQLVGPL